MLKIQPAVNVNAPKNITAQNKSQIGFRGMKDINAISSDFVNIAKVRLYTQKGDPSIPKELAENLVKQIQELKNGGLKGELVLRELIANAQSQFYQFSDIAKSELVARGLIDKKGHFTNPNYQKILNVAGKGNGMDFKFINPLTGAELA